VIYSERTKSINFKLWSKILKHTNPGTFIRQELEQKGWSQRDLAEITGRPYQMINELIQGKRSLLPDMAIALGIAFGTGPEIWMKRECEYQLAKTISDSGPIERRRKLFELAPIIEMQRRNWIPKVTGLDELESALCTFYEISSIGNKISNSIMARKSDSGSPLTPSQQAWCGRVRQIAKSKLVAEYENEYMESCIKELKKIAAYPQEIYKVPNVLENYGIRFVIVEPLHSCKVDGIALWLDKQSPVIGMSCRLDRVDSFWFTLCHELSHILNRDEAPLDSNLGGIPDDLEDLIAVQSEIERRANENAANMLIPKKELESFINRMGPLYSKVDIIQFAHRIKIHPGIIVGQLQYRKEIGYQSNREMLSKVRQFVTQAAMTDGWGNTISLS